MTTKLHIAKQDGRWHVHMKWTDPAMGPTGKLPIGVGWTSWDLAMKAAINYIATKRRIINGQTYTQTNGRIHVAGAVH